MEGETKTARIDQKSKFFYFFVFFYHRFRVWGNLKHQFLKEDCIKMFWVECWPFFKQAHLVVGIINPMISFILYFPCPASFFLWLWEVTSWNFQIITLKIQRDGVYILLHRKSQDLRRFRGNFLFPRINHQ